MPWPSKKQKKTEAARAAKLDPNRFPVKLTPFKRFFFSISFNLQAVELEQTTEFVEHISIECQHTSFEDSEYIPSQEEVDETYDKCFLSVLGQLTNFFVDSFGPNWSNLMKRNMSVLISIILKHFKISNKDIDRILNLCDLLTFETAHFWTKQYSDGDYSGLDLEGRRNGRTDLFYDTFPDIENSARIWSIVQSKDRSAKFSPYDLALYISKVYEEETNSELTDGKLIRSESSCRRDLLRWGFYLGKNKNRPYYLGHEREDVVIHRNEFTKYFVERKHLYWTLTDTEDKENCEWTMPMRQENGDKKVALFCHDEVNNRRGEVSEKKWFYPGEEPFFQKGRMQSIMQSWFILAHPSGPYFQLSDEEFKLACKSYSELEEPDELYYPREASAQIILDGKNYFDSEIFLQQMERLLNRFNFQKH